jgi:hypothetical protein
VLSCGPSIRDFAPRFHFVQYNYWCRGRSKLPNYTSLDWWGTIYVYIIMKIKKHHRETLVSVDVKINRQKIFGSYRVFCSSLIFR